MEGRRYDDANRGLEPQYI